MERQKSCCDREVYLRIVNVLEKISFGVCVEVVLVGMLRLCLITTHGEENKWLGESCLMYCPTCFLAIATTSF